MLAARITLLHFSASAAMNLPKSAGEPASDAAPKSASRAFMSGSVRATFISLFSLSMISGGVFLGAATPNQLLASKPGRNSPTVGTPGRISERSAVVTAMIERVTSVGQQAADLSEVTERIDGREAVASRQQGDLGAMAGREDIRHHVRPSVQPSFWRPSRNA